MTGAPVVFEDDSVASQRCSCGAWIVGSRRHACRAPQADWAHLSSDVLSAVVLRNHLDSHKQMHLVCRQWTTSVRCNLHTMQPAALSTEQLKLYFPAVRHLFLNKVAFKQNSTLCLATLRKLQTLSLGDCSFEKCESIAELAALSGLTRLQLHTLTGPDPQQYDDMLHSMSKLQHLQIHKGPVVLASGKPPTHMTMPTLSNLSSLTRLTELALSDVHNRLSLPGLQHLPCLSNLRKLKLAKVGVTNGVLRGMSGLTLLDELLLPNSHRITDVGLGFFSGLTNLSALELSNPLYKRDVEISDAGIANLAGLDNLCHLSLSGHQCLSSQGLMILSSMTALTYLDLSDTPPWGEGHADFLTSLTSLQVLDLARTYVVSPHLEVLSKLCCLRQLDLSHTAIEGNTLQAVSPALSGLQKLDVSYTPVDHKALVHTTKAMKDLHFLRFDGCSVSTLGAYRLLKCSPHNKLQCWRDDRQDMPRWMNIVDTMLVAMPAPNHRRLRVFHKREDSLAVTALVFILVFLFFMFYISLLLLFFTSVFLFPFVMVGVCVVTGCLAILGAKMTFGSLVYVWHKMDRCTSAFLLGMNHANNVVPHGHQEDEV
ncbi:hypothetical protein WJX77_004971 [Trebouxia sp. C0004]